MSRTVLLLFAVSVAACSPLAPAATAVPRREAIDTISFETTEGTRLALDVSPDGRYLLIDLLGQLWRVPMVGGDAIPITNAVRDTAEDFDPAVSPDGRRVVFESDRPAGRGLWLIATDGAGARKLTSRFVEYFAYLSPSWAPDGRRVVYNLADTLVVLDVNSGREIVLRIDSLPRSGMRPSGMIPGRGSPRWSRDGMRIAFVNAAGPGNRAEGRIWEAPASGGTARPITTMPALAPEWSPDGSRLAFFAADSANRWQVYVQGRDGVARRLTNHAEVVTFRVRWTPDGRSLVYAADGGLWRVASDGGAPITIPFRARVTMPRRRVALKTVDFLVPGEERIAKGFTAIALSPDAKRMAMIALDTLWVGNVGAAPRPIAPANGAGDRTLAWSSDGAEVAWTRRDGPTRALNLVGTNTRTGVVRVIAALGQDIDSPVWSPDGQWIAFVAGARLRVIDARGARVDSLKQCSDLGPASGFAGSFVWTPNSDAIVVAEFDLQQRRAKADWVSLTGERRTIPRFPRAPADLHLSADGRATWVEDNLLWRAAFDGRTGLTDTPVPLSSDAAVEARHAADGSILYLSADGLRLRAANGAVRSISWPLRYRAAAAPPSLLIRGARVIDGRGSPLTEPRDILVEGGRVARVAPTGTIQAAGIRIIDATDKYVIPGLIDLHAHIWDDVLLLAWLHNGVTTIRDIASQRLKTPDTRNSIAAGIRPGPRVVYGGAMFHRGGVGYSTLTDQMTRDSASLARAVAIMAGMDASYLKERGFSEWLSAVQLVGEAHKYGLTVSGHCEHILPVVAAGVDGAEHILDCFRIAYTMRSDFAQLARAAGLWIVPTAALRFSMLRVMDDPALLPAPDVAPLLPPAFRSVYGTDSIARRSIPALSATVKRLESSTRAYNQAGVTLATGTDSPFPLGIQHEMEVLVESGLTPMEAIVAATGTAARVLNAPRIGTIAEGQWADLVLLDANPLEDIRNTRRIREVIQGGRIVDRSSLRQQAAMR